MTRTVIQVVYVRYPHVMVQRANFYPQSSYQSPCADTAREYDDRCYGRLEFNLLPGDNPPPDTHEVVIACGCGIQSVCADFDITVTLNDEVFDNWLVESTQHWSKLIVSAPGWLPFNASQELRFIVTLNIQ